MCGQEFIDDNAACHDGGSPHQQYDNPDVDAGITGRPLKGADKIGGPPGQYPVRGSAQQRKSYKVRENEAFLFRNKGEYFAKGKVFFFAIGFYSSFGFLDKQHGNNGHNARKRDDDISAIAAICCPCNGEPQQGIE